jgi:hypothetical protein
MLVLGTGLSTSPDQPHISGPNWSISWIRVSLAASPAMRSYAVLPTFRPWLRQLELA